jgi:isopenicillin-N epimerase
MLAYQDANGRGRDNIAMRAVPAVPSDAFPRLLPDLWELDPDIRFLNHGSFGSLPEPIHLAAMRWRAQVERRPIEMLARRMPELLREARSRVASFLGSHPDRTGFVTNATAACNSALAAVDWQRGDRVLFINHGYNAVRQCIHHHAVRGGAEIDIVDIPWPIDSARSIADRVVGAIRRRTRMLVLDQVTSPTALVLPVADIVRHARDAGVLTLVDGAHAPGMVPLDVDAIGADWWCGNLHKWCYAPKGCAVLVVSERQRDRTHPPVISHHLGRSFAEEFDWQGTFDAAPWLCAGDAIAFTTSAAGGTLRERNRQLARWAHDMLCERLGESPLVQSDAGTLLGSMACVRVPDACRRRFASAMEMQAWLYEERRIEIPVIDFGGWHVRLSAAPYNAPEDYECLADALRA